MANRKQDIPRDAARYSLAATRSLAQSVLGLMRLTYALARDDVRGTFIETWKELQEKVVALGDACEAWRTRLNAVAVENVEWCNRRSSNYHSLVHSAGRDFYTGVSLSVCVEVSGLGRALVTMTLSDSEMLALASRDKIYIKVLKDDEITEAESDELYNNVVDMKSAFSRLNEIEIPASVIVDHFETVRTSVLNSFVRELDDFDRLSVCLDCENARTRELRVEALQKESKPMLTDTEQAVWDYVEEHDPKAGKEIAKALDIKIGTLTKHIVPKLKPLGLRNKRGAGYYIEKD